jgi:hypothetical protein
MGRMPETKTTTPRGAGPRKKKPQPLIRSVLALRIAVAALTTLSLGGMTAYAGTHVYSSSAPLVVALADDSAASAASTSTPTQTSSVTTVTSSVRTTTASQITATRQS